MESTSYQVKYVAHEVTLRSPLGSPEKRAGVGGFAGVDLSPREGDKPSAEPNPIAVEVRQYQSKQNEHPENIPSVVTPVRSPLDTGFSDFLNEFCGVNTLLLSAIHAAGGQGALPYQTVRAYVESGAIGRDRLLEVEGLNQELLDELDELIADSGYILDANACVVTASSADSAHSPEHEMDDELSGEAMLSLPLLEFVAKQKNASIRLSNALSFAERKGTCPFETIGDYLQCASREAVLRKIANIGRKTAAEFEELVCQSILLKVATPPVKVCASVRPNNRGYVDVGAIVKGALSLLTSRQQDVIIERLVERKTLEVLGSAIGVTRERIRQIEVKSLRLISTKIGSVLLEAGEIICARFCDKGLYELSLEDFSELVTCDLRDAALYLTLLKKLDSGQSTLGLAEGNVFVRNHYLPRGTWGKALADELRIQPLPLTLDGILSSVSSVPGFYIRDYFQRWSERQGGEDGDLGPSYGTPRMCIDVLRKAGRPLHTSDIRARICELFHVDVEEHAINAALGRQKEALITGPGTYALYECLPFTPAQIESIRNTAYEYLEAKGVFLSSKILFDLAIAKHIDEFPDGLNHYVVMGIVQDDERFVTKRGNMVGLVEFDLSETYKPLQDEIRRIVLDHGPITLPEIAERLSDTRRLCNDSGIRVVLSRSPDIIKIGRRKFDALHRFFDTRQIYENFLLAIRISLLEKRKTTYAITQDLDRLNFRKMTSQLVESMLSSIEDIRSEGGVHELLGVDRELAEYNTIVLRILQMRGTAEDVQTLLRNKISGERLTTLTSLDTRFLVDSAASPVSMGAEISSILEDFDF